MLLLRKKA